ncbi:ribosomal protein S18-alanine N-acetyltransferase [bacterium]|nr:ribosomal protein S18-alanine N-acetyltransferase [bacterium]
MQSQQTATDCVSDITLIDQFGADWVDQILEIEKLSFSNPWSRDSFLSELNSKNSIRFAALSDSQLVGYLFAHRIEDELEVLEFAVSKAERGKGIGRRLITKLIDHARATSTSRILLELRHSNHEAFCLYDTCGFKPYGVRQAYYRNPQEDALLMQFVTNRPNL